MSTTRRPGGSGGPGGPGATAPGAPGAPGGSGGSGGPGGPGGPDYHGGSGRTSPGGTAGGRPGGPGGGRRQAARKTPQEAPQQARDGAPTGTPTSAPTGLPGDAAEPAPTIRVAGPYGLLAEVGDTAAVRALDARLRAALGTDPALRAAVEDVVPAARTLLVTVRQTPGATAALARVAALLDHPPPAAAAPAGPGPLVVLPCRYDGPDLEEVARRCHLTPRQLVQRHTATEFTVAFCGFAPGFAYLTGWPEELRVPRRDTPRPSVPTGSVGLGGAYCGVYPRSSPGGWQIIGRTGAVLFDPDRDPPALLAPGTRVRFTAEPGGELP